MFREVFCKEIKILTSRPNKIESMNENKLSIKSEQSRLIGA